MNPIVCPPPVNVTNVTISPHYYHHCAVVFLSMQAGVCQVFFVMRQFVTVLAFCMCKCLYCNLCHQCLCGILMSCLHCHKCGLHCHNCLVVFIVIIVYVVVIVHVFRNCLCCQNCLCCHNWTCCPFCHIYIVYVVRIVIIAYFVIMSMLS